MSSCVISTNILHLIVKAGADHPRTPVWGEHREKRPYRGVKGALKKALLVVKGRIGWHKGRIRLQRAIRPYT